MICETPHIVLEMLSGTRNHQLALENKRSICNDNTILSCNVNGKLVGGEGLIDMGCMGNKRI